MKRAVLFLNGDLEKEISFYKNKIKETDYIAAADGGAEYLFDLAIKPDLIIGDFDSVSKETLNYYKTQEVKMEEFTAEKDKTDGELILDKLINMGFSEIIIFAALGGRIDHQLGNILLLTKYKEKECNLKIVTPNQQLELITSEKKIENRQGKTISLISLNKETTGLKLMGFKYETENVSIKKGSTLGISNIINSDNAQIEIEKGELLLVLNF